MITENPSEKQNHDSLALLMIVKENIEGLIKGRGVADGRKQSEKIEPKDNTSTIVSTEAVILIAKINAL